MPELTEDSGVPFAMGGVSHGCGCLGCLLPLLAVLAAIGAVVMLLA